MIKQVTVMVAACLLLNVSAHAGQKIKAYKGIPAITGKPVIDVPNNLNWKTDFDSSKTDLTEPTSNRIFDLHSNIADCDIVLSTAGNYHMALRDLWYDHFLTGNKDVNNWFYTTSPPVSYGQIKNSELSIANWKSSCMPNIAVGPKGLMKKLSKAGLIEANPEPVIRNYGNVLLVKKGNPKNIRSVWDLARKDVRIVTSNPYSEPGSFGNYTTSIYKIAKKDKNAPAGMTAEKLFDSIYGKDNGNKWLAGARIHHREVPWSVAYGQADVGPMFYHLALYAKRSFPDTFDIVPLGGTVEKPEALPGNKIGTMFLAKVKGKWTPKQNKLREELIRLYKTEAMSSILKEHGLTRPPKFVAQK